MRTYNLRLRPPSLLIRLGVACGLIGLLAFVGLRGDDRSKSRLSVSGAAASGQPNLTTFGTGVPPSATLSPEKAANVMEVYARSPLSIDPHERSSGEFYSRGQGYSLCLTAQEVRLIMRQTQRPPFTRRQIITLREDEAPEPF